jgi:hypothetical protein
MTADFTEDDYYQMIDDVLNQPVEVAVDNRSTYPMDRVAGPVEWKRFKRAMVRWLAEQDASHEEAFDNQALEEEHGDGE